ncbi:MAG: hypothetical protein ABFS35_04435 [Bacteroidota bacterium]
MNKWILTGIIVLGLLIIVGVLFDHGAFDNIEGSFIGVILAAIAGPYMAFKNFMFGNKPMKDFEVKYNQMRDETVKHRVELDARIGAKERRIAELDKELELIETKMDILELKKKNVKREVNKMSIEETKQDVHDLFGD